MKLLPPLPTTVTAPYRLPPSMSLGVVAHHVHNYVKGNSTIYYFRASAVGSYRRLLDADHEKNNIVRPLRYTTYKVKLKPHKLFPDVTLPYEYEFEKYEDWRGDWKNEDRKREKIETAAAYFPALDRGFLQLAEQFGKRSLRGALRLLQRNDIQLEELPGYVRCGFVSPRTAGGLLASLIEKNAQAGWSQSIDIFAKWRPFWKGTFLAAGLAGASATAYGIAGEEIISSMAQGVGNYVPALAFAVGGLCVGFYGRARNIHEKNEERLEALAREISEHTARGMLEQKEGAVTTGDQLTELLSDLLLSAQLDRSAGTEEMAIRRIQETMQEKAKLVETLTSLSPDESKIASKALSELLRKAIDQTKTELAAYEEASDALGGSARIPLRVVPVHDADPEVEDAESEDASSENLQIPVNGNAHVAR